MKTSKNKIFIIILALLISGLFNFTSSNSFASSGPVSISINANLTNVNKGDKFTLTWSSVNTDGCVAHSNTQSPWYGIRAISGNEVITPAQTATYFITCSNTSGYSGMVQTTVTVSGSESAVPTVFITANPKIISRGGSTNLVWSSGNVDRCEASGGWSGIKPIFGSETVIPGTTTVYTITCGNNLRSVFESVVVEIIPSGIIISPGPAGFNAACVPSSTSIRIGEAVIFAGAQSYGTEPVTYRWGGDISGNTQSVRLSFPSIGTKTAQLTVTDATGKTALASCSVQVVSGGSTSPTTIVKASKLAAPTNLKPNGDEFPGDTEEVILSWDSVKGAKFYAVRLDPESKTDERDSKNNCPVSPHYFCVNNIDSNSIKVSVKAGNTYYWWVHAIGSNGVYSDPAHAKFSVKAEETGLKSNFLANIFSGISGQGVLFWILIILAFIIGYLIGRARKTSLNL